MAAGEVNQFQGQERRQARRYDVLLPVVVQAAARQCCSARSRDISTGGTYLFVESDDLFPGTKVELTLSFPKELTGGTGMLMRAHGQIIRVDRYSGDETRRLGVAVVFDTYDLIPSTSPNC
jgi:PilZ domain